MIVVDFFMFMWDGLAECMMLEFFSILACTAEDKATLFLQT